MRPSIALNRNRNAARKIVSRFRATNLRVFGSVLHGTDKCNKDDSDLDLLVDTLPGATLFDLGELQVELEELLGVNVDLLTPGDLPQKFRDQVVGEAQPV
ncbi:MAG: nucleotidyltransferase domain-containing protein [Burkholderiales bacterium]|nr:nucleotidyltransferase domain-containing protein [Nitrosomonas sp.]MCP5274876.1 nucleotidyltransferase domain-containing protein [Burkholderiales bacterium]